MPVIFSEEEQWAFFQETDADKVARKQSALCIEPLIANYYFPVS